MRIVNLKKEKQFLNSYVELRNRYVEELLTNPVSLKETEQWLSATDVEIRGLVEDDLLLGVVILYCQKDAEVTIFVQRKNQGIGTKLLTIIEEVAKEKKIPYLWAWVRKDNLIAQRIFIKAGYTEEKIEERIYKNSKIKGIRFKKWI